MRRVRVGPSSGHEPPIWPLLGMHLTQVAPTGSMVAEMEDYPRTLQEFEARFSTEEGCREYLFRLRWPEGFRCPRCGCGKAWAVRATLFQCSRCNCQTSVTAGTVFQDTRKALPVWFRAMWFVTSQKKRCQRPGLAAGPGTRQLSNRLVVAAQIAARDGSIRSRSAGRLGGSGRDLPGRPRGRRYRVGEFRTRL